MIRRGKLHYIMADLKPTATWKKTGSVSVYLEKVAKFDAYLREHGQAS